MARPDRENGKLLGGLAIGAVIVAVNVIRNWKSLPPLADDLAQKARQGIDDVRQEWSDQVSEATGGAEDLKGRSFLAAAGLTFASMFITACVDQAKKEAERKAERTVREPSAAAHSAPTFGEWIRTIPADRVFEPSPLAGARYEPTSNRRGSLDYLVMDPATGETMRMSSGQGRGPPNFRYYDPRGDVSINGTCRHPLIADGSDYRALEITSAKYDSGQPVGAALNVERTAQLIRAYWDVGRKRDIEQNPRLANLPVRKAVIVDSREKYTDADIRREFPS